MICIHDAESLHRHGWMSTDKVGLMRQYSLSEEDAEEVCKALARIEDGENVRIRYTVRYGGWTFWEGEDAEEAQRQYLACGPYGTITEEVA